MVDPTKTLNYELVFLLQKYREKKGYDHFAFHHIPKNLSCEQSLIFSSYPALWVKQYVHRKYQDVDYALKGASASSTPFVWGGHLWDDFDTRQRELYSEASTYDIKSGYTYRFHDDTGETYLTLSSSLVEGEFLNKHASSVVDLMSFNLHLHRLTEKRKERQPCSELLDIIFKKYIC